MLPFKSSLYIQHWHNSKKIPCLELSSPWLDFGFMCRMGRCVCVCVWIQIDGPACIIKWCSQANCANLDFADCINSKALFIFQKQKYFKIHDDCEKKVVKCRHVAPLGWGVYSTNGILASLCDSKGHFQARILSSELHLMLPNCWSSSVLYHWNEHSSGIKLFCKMRHAS